MRTKLNHTCSLHRSVIEPAHSVSLADMQHLGVIAMARIHTYAEFENVTVDDVVKALKAAGYVVVTRGDCWVIVDSDAAIAIRNIIWEKNDSTYCLVNTIDPDEWDANQFVELHCPG